MSNLSNKIEEQFVNATAKRIYSGSLDWTSIKNNLEFKNIPRSRIGELQKIAQSKAQSMQLQLLHNRSSRK
jgi:hypothetical protein